MRNWLTDIAVALALLTRLPLPRLPEAAFAQAARAAWAYPLAGAVVSGLAVLAGLAATRLGLPVAVIALIVIAVEITLTGAMHEDGLADTADGLWGGWTAERRLEIMRDSQIGTYGVLALVLGVGLRGAAIAALAGLGASQLVVALLVAAMLSRGALPAMMHLIPHARADGLSKSVGRPGAAAATIAAALALILSVGLASPVALAAAAIGWLGCAGLGGLARARIGGQTGDILGAAQQVCTILVLLTFLGLAS